MQKQRENLISIIDRCNCNKTKAKWIIELSHTEIECTESQCTSCLIAIDCNNVLDTYYLGANGGL